MVTGLAKEYINQPDCLILLALTMKGLAALFHEISLAHANNDRCADDAVNQSAARIAHEYGEERTIGKCQIKT